MEIFAMNIREGIISRILFYKHIINCVFSFFTKVFIKETHYIIDTKKTYHANCDYYKIQDVQNRKCGDMSFSLECNS